MPVRYVKQLRWSNPNSHANKIGQAVKMKHPMQKSYVKQLRWSNPNSHANKVHQAVKINQPY